MNEKVIGYSLVIIGILTILFSAISVYLVFTKKSEPVKLFNFQGIGLDLASLFSDSLPPETSKLLNQNQGKSTRTEIISADLVNDTSNIFAHLLLMGFIASMGYKLASLGVMLVRPIVVKLKAKEVTTDN